MDNDFKELLSAFNDHKVKYLIVGGYAVSYHSEPRFTKDLNVFIQSTPENAKAVFQALAEYETPLEEITLEDFVNPETIFQLVSPLNESTSCRRLLASILKPHGTIVFEDP